MHRNRLGRSLIVAAALIVSATFPVWAKDTMVVGLPIEPSGLDPTIAAPVAIREVTWGNIFEGLTTIDKDGKVQPLLAESWDISADGLTYTFKLRHGVEFHNGTPFDSSIVKFSLDRARSPESTNAQKQFFEPIASIDAPDPFTAIIKLKHPAGLFTYWLAWGDAVMIDPKTVETNKTAPIGTGPFKFMSWKRGDQIVLDRNDSYWQAGTPKMKEVTFRFIGDPQAQAAALRAGDLDAFPNFTAPELFGEFEHDVNFTAVVGLTPRKVVAALNNTTKPLNDVRVRQALMSAIDRKVVIEGAYSGFGTPIGSHFSPSDQGYVDETGVLPYNSEKAKVLLNEAGYGGGLTLTMKVPQMSYTMRSAEVMQAMLAEVGVTLTIVPTEFPAKWVDEVFLRKDYEISIVDHAEPMDIDIYARSGYYFNYLNPDFNKLMTAANATSDSAERAKLNAEAQAILAKDVPALYLFDLPRLGIFKKKLEGFWSNEPISQVLVKDAYWSE